MGTTTLKSSTTSMMSSSKRRVFSTGTTFQMLVFYLLAEHRKNARPLLIGLISVFLVVAFLTLVRNTLVKSPLVFLKVAEDSVGQIDLILTSSNTSQPLLNYTDISKLIQNVPLLAGACPRWIFNVNITQPPQPPWEPLPIPAPVLTSSTLLIFNTTHEKSICLAPTWPFRALGKNEVHVSKTLIGLLNKTSNKGDQLTLQIDLLSLVPDGTKVGNLLFRNRDLYFTLTALQVRQITFITGASYSDVMATAEDLGNNQYLVSGRALSNNQLSQYTTLQSSFDIVDALPTSTYGKYPAGLGHLVLLEQEATNIWMKEYLTRITRNPLFTFSNALNASFISTFDLADYTFSIILLIKDRIQVYMQSTTEIQKTLVRFSDQLRLSIGIERSIQMTDLLNKALFVFSQTRMFWDQAFVIVIVMLVLLCSLLIYTLLLSNVESKTFEFGLLRTLGLAQPKLISLMVLQALMFAVPGIFFGLLVCFILYVPIDFLLGKFAEAPLDLFLDSTAGLLGVGLGFALPFIGMWVPVRRALSVTLKDALDMYHHAIFDAIVSIKKLKDLGMHHNETFLALIIVGLSILVYYAGPVSFAMNLLDLLTKILSVLLVVMILGQIILLQLLQPYLEWIVLHCLVWGRDRLFKPLIKKNLIAHRSRNHKASLTFTLCIGYLLCSGALFQLQTQSLVENLEWSLGADVQVSTSSIIAALPESMFNAFLNDPKTNPSMALAWTYVSFPLNSIGQIPTIQFSSLAAMNRAKVQVIGVESNYLDATLADRFYFPVNLASPSLPLFSQLNHTQPMPVIVSEATSEYVYLAFSDISRLDINYVKQGEFWPKSISVLCQNLGIVKKLPGFPNINRLTISNAPLLVSMSSFQFLLDQLVALAQWPSINSKVIPKQYLRLRLNPSASEDAIQFFLNSLGTAIQKSNVTQLEIKNLKESKVVAESSLFFVKIFFYTVAAVGIILCFFVLWLSFTSSIKENIREFGILRAIGMKASVVIRIYVYESLILVFTSLLIGTIVGCTTSITLTLQLGLFTEMPFTFYFPMYLFLVVVVLAILIAILGSYLPSRDYCKKSLSNLLREH